MAMKISGITRILLATLLAVSVLSWPRAARGCGPFLASAIFTYTKHPDLPMKGFAGGELGVLQPTYARSYLAVAYRYLSGDRLDPEEQKGVTALWNERLSYGPQDDDAISKPWADARNSVSAAGPAPAIRELFRPVSDKDSYQQYLNCTAGAFQTAAATLSKRIERFGANSPEVKDWVQAQDQVFSNCSGGSQIPALAKSASPAAIQADRAYQMAAANFYAGNFDAAEKMFKDIAADSGSSWSHIAPYLAARTLVRKATLIAGAGKTDPTVLGEAESQLIRILADSRTGDLRPAAARLMSFVRFRLHPEERLHELAGAVVKKNADATLKQDLCDYTLLMDSFERDNYDELPGAVKKDDITDWIFTFKASGKAALDHSAQKWNQTHSLPWLIAVLSKTGRPAPGQSDLINAAAAVRQGSPAFESVAFHSIRLLIRSGKRDEARTKLDALLSRGRQALPESARNLFMSERLLVARSMDDFLKYAMRVPATVTTDMEGNEMPDEDSDTKKESPRPIFDGDSAAIMNMRIPVAMLAKASSSMALPVHLRRQMALAVWVKAAMLDEAEIAAELTPVLEAQLPKLKPELDSYAKASGPDAKRFAAVFLMLKFPGTRPYVEAGVGRTTELDKIDDYRDNWWCALNNVTRLSLPNLFKFWGDEDQDTKTAKPKPPEPGSPDFLTEPERTQAAAEWKKLAVTSVAPNYLPAQAVEWVNKNPEDPRAAEALYLAVRATRYGCTDKDTPKFSKAAFDVLHKRYPNSDWAKKTKYWYGK